MNRRSTFVRKIVYLVAIALLLIPLFWLSQPATNAVKGVQGSPGGALARLRAEYHLSQAQLGEVDPSSATIKLATLGLRGVAANILWEKATDYKMKKDWTNFGATLNQITKVQPNFLNVWINQAWNLSYNCSVQFDDYRERYRWVIKGFDFLKDGIKHNERQPRLLWELGRMISQKIGKADESKQFRRLFKKDDDFNGDLPVAERDNWLVGKKWYDDAVKMVDDIGGVFNMGQSPLIYRSSGPLCQMYYADGLEKDGTFGEVAKGAWATAAGDWDRYGDEDIPTSFKREDTGEPIRIHLNDMEREEKTAAQLVARLAAIQPGLREKITAEKKAKLSDAQRQALETPLQKRTGEQFKLAAQAEAAIAVTHDEVAHRITGPKRKEAIRLAKEAAEHKQLAFFIGIDRGTVNFAAWRQRAQAEQTPELITARDLVFRGDRAYAENDLVPARNFYNQALTAWRKALDAHKEYITDDVNCEDLTDMVKRYRRILGQLDERFPQPFILQDVLDAEQKRSGGAKP
jgi:hypothetical protein